MSKISELSDGGALQSTDYLIAVRSGGNVKVQPAGMTFSSATFTTADINGGTIDGVTIGGSSAGAITGTTGQFNTSVAINTTSPSTYLHIVPLDGFSNDPFQGLRISRTASLKAAQHSTYSHASGSATITSTVTTLGAGGGFTVRSSADGATSKPLLLANSNNDFTLYEDTGTTAKFFWDASAESLGIGTTSPQRLLHINSASVQIGALIESTSTASARLALSNANTTSTSKVGIGAIADDLALYAGGLQAVTVDDSGNVGIGTSSPQVYTNLKTISVGGSQGGVLDFVAGAVGTGANRVAQLYGGNGGFLSFGTGASDSIEERMRIDSSGNLLVGTTTAVGTVTIGGSFTPNQPALYMKTYPTSHPTAYIYRDNTDAQYCLKLRHDGPVSGSGNGYMVLFTDRNDATVGSITVSGSTTAYNTSSDARLKENIADAEDAGAKVDAIQVRQFDWKADGSHQDYGMIAQELIEVAPEAVSGDPESDDMMGVDFSKLVPMLVKEIQSLRARVAQLEGA